MDNWEQDRWAWKRAVRCDSRLSDGAKVLAAALCDDFAHRKSPFCSPGIATLADALGKKPRAVLYALAELRKFAWVRVEERRGRGNSSIFHFQKGDGSVPFGGNEKVQHIAHAAMKKVQEVAPLPEQKVQDMVANSATYGPSPCTPYNDKPTINQRARASAERPAPQCRACIHPGSDQEVAWNGWLQAHGFPTLTALGIRSSDQNGSGWDAPSRYPPTDDASTAGRIALKWAEWASCRMLERRSA